MTDTKTTKTTKKKSAKSVKHTGGSSKLTAKMKTTLHAIIQLLCDELPEGCKCTVIDPKNNGIFMLKHHDPELGKDILLHNITPGLLLVNKDRLTGFIVSCITGIKKYHMLKKAVSFKVSVYDDMITAPILKTLKKNYPLLTNENMDKAVRSLYRFSISNCEEFPVREAAYRIHSLNPYVLAEGVDLIKITKDGVKGVKRNLDKYLIYEDVLHTGKLIAIGNIKLKPGFNNDWSPDEKILKELYVIATQVLGTSQFSEAMKLCMVETASRVEGNANITTDMEVALTRAFG